MKTVANVLMVVLMTAVVGCATVVRPQQTVAGTVPGICEKLQVFGYMVENKDGVKETTILYDYVSDWELKSSYTATFKGGMQGFSGEGLYFVSKNKFGDLIFVKVKPKGVRPNGRLF